MGTSLCFSELARLHSLAAKTMSIVPTTCELLTARNGCVHRAGVCLGLMVRKEATIRIVRGQSAFGRLAFSKTFENSTIRQIKLPKAACAWLLSAETKIYYGRAKGDIGSREAELLTPMPRALSLRTCPAARQSLSVV